jgi:hypothetical protein
MSSLLSPFTNVITKRDGCSSVNETVDCVALGLGAIENLSVEAASKRTDVLRCTATMRRIFFPPVSETYSVSPLGEAVMPLGRVKGCARKCAFTSRVHTITRKNTRLPRGKHFVDAVFSTLRRRVAPNRDVKRTSGVAHIADRILPFGDEYVCNLLQTRRTCCRKFEHLALSTIQKSFTVAQAFLPVSLFNNLHRQECLCHYCF